MQQGKESSAEGSLGDGRGRVGIGIVCEGEGRGQDRTELLVIKNARVHVCISRSVRAPIKIMLLRAFSCEKYTWQRYGMKRHGDYLYHWLLDETG